MARPKARHDDRPSVSRGHGLIVAERGGITVIQIDEPSLSQAAVVQRIGSALRDIAEEQSNARMIIDFTEVQSVSSMAIGEIITLQKLIQSKGGQLRLAALSPAIRAAFRTLGLDRRLKIHDSVRDAENAFAENPGALKRLCRWLLGNGDKG